MYQSQESVSDIKHHYIGNVVVISSVHFKYAEFFIGTSFVMNFNMNAHKPCSVCLGLQSQGSLSWLCGCLGINLREIVQLCLLLAAQDFGNTI